MRYVLQSVLFITKHDKKYIQHMTGIIKCGIYYKVRPKITAKCDRCYKKQQEFIQSVIGIITKVTIVVRRNTLLNMSTFILIKAASVRITFSRFSGFKAS